ncbi:cytochrome c biogenesis CcdA family protein [Blastochloris sulfoviridis]|uniref:Cytochrome c biogenesis protein CcdA n=1 Tax=Blastochloris sulfoviridis TaxID=50712 RepID=A0A5M6I3D1_9HYPH|nr:cytochrome c biogenesis protein CcdA [Blastochloris sulfoviridis]KAA5602716.1 cytochrome c biogenesis protein CcdA [Blastochloris sulfoviridis]
MTDVTFPAAFVAGLISFLSPCVLPLVPPYLVYLAGTTLDRLQTEAEPAAARRALAAAALFVLGFSSVFVALGAGASVIGQVLRTYSTVLSTVAGIAIIIMGLHFLGLFRIPFLMREVRAEVRRPVSLAGAYGMGLAFAFGWTPCIGPVLATILAVAAADSTLGKGAGLLAVYSAGLGVPFLAAALFVGPFLRVAGRLKRHLGLIEKAMGVLLVVTGLAFLFGWVADAAYLILEAVPALGKLG